VVIVCETGCDEVHCDSLPQTMSCQKETSSWLVEQFVMKRTVTSHLMLCHAIKRLVPG